MSKSGYRILAVTACPTGIAHTYMAAESLESKGKEMGVSIKVETNGSGGAKNVLTREEIADADCIIIAADKNVEKDDNNYKEMQNKIEQILSSGDSSGFKKHVLNELSLEGY